MIWTDFRNPKRQSLQPPLSQDIIFHQLVDEVQGRNFHAGQVAFWEAQTFCSLSRSACRWLGQLKESLTPEAKARHHVEHEWNTSGTQWQFRIGDPNACSFRRPRGFTIFTFLKHQNNTKLKETSLRSRAAQWPVKQLELLFTPSCLNSLLGQLSENENGKHSFFRTWRAKRSAAVAGSTSCGTAIALGRPSWKNFLLV